MSKLLDTKSENAANLACALESSGNPSLPSPDDEAEGGDEEIGATAGRQRSAVESSVSGELTTSAKQRQHWNTHPNIT
jgi:hypothetical protein